MAKSKTGSFWLTEAVSVAVGSNQGSGTLDLGAYVDVGDQQAIAIEYVDYIWQREASGIFDSYINDIVPAEASLTAQLTDLNPGSLVLRADDNSLISQGQLHISTGLNGAGAMENTNILTAASSFYPDVYGKLDESRMVVNDSLFVLIDCNGNVANNDLVCTVRIKARIVKLSTKDWMAIAIQSTASDN